MTLPGALRSQALACESLGSPFMGRLLRCLADIWDPRSAIATHIAARFDGDIGPGGHSVPLRLAGCLHSLVLRDMDPSLSTVYPPLTPDDGVFRSTIAAALETHADYLIDWMAMPPQTNEVRRAIGLIATAHWVAARHPLPFVTSELGASAGLNLNWDRYALTIGDRTWGPDDPILTLTPDWTGPLPPQSEVSVTDRGGVDLRPVDLGNPNEVLRLLSYLWPDQPDRMARTRKAIAAQTTRVDPGDAIDWLEPRLTPRPGHIHMVYHTIAWQYFPKAAQARGTALIEAAGEKATDASPLAWVSMEADGQRGSAALTCRLWPGGTKTDLGRIDYHGRSLHWTA